MSSATASGHDERPDHGHYYIAAGRGKLHLVTARRRQGSSFETTALCGRSVRRARVMTGDGHHHYRTWAGKYRQDLCGDCIRYAAEDPDLKWRGQMQERAEQSAIEGGTP